MRASPSSPRQAVHNSGYVAMLEGDLVTALQTMQRVRAPLDAESEALGGDRLSWIARRHCATRAW